jgi:hypothetical protein
MPAWHKSGANFETRVRHIAEYIWGRKCISLKIGGVQVDGVLSIDPEISIFVEMTEERTLQKVREDISKLQIAKAAAFSTGNLARCFCVIDGTVTNAMKEAGKPLHIRVLSVDDFTKLFFDFEPYHSARTIAPFGSSVNPLTGASDDTEYVQVRYLVDGRKGEITTSDIAGYLREGKNVILLGEYGSGKSRCIREVFKRLSETATTDFCYPIAIDLRKSWGLRQSGELIRRHFSDLGLDSVSSSAIRAFRVGSLALLLDGFDEIGSQAWSNDGARLKAIRAKSLEGVKEAVTENHAGTLIAGREHYFSSSEEMFTALGVDPKSAIVVRSKDEFNDTELLEYFRARDIDVDIPPWLPRRPLICQTISDLASEQLAQMFGDQGSEVEFWTHFIKVLCERDAKIHASFDPDTIYKIFVYLSRLTRSKSANVGPISLAELQFAFEAATGAAPIEDASIMLQRLPSLGRVSAESNDRQFVDIYILDGLRAKDIINVCKSTEGEFSSILSATWINPLDDLGQRVLAADPGISESAKIEFCGRAVSAGNMVFACDLFACLIRSNQSTIDFKNLKLSQGEFLFLTLSERGIANATLSECYIGEVEFPIKGCMNVSIEDCVTPTVRGVSSATALPPWIKRLEVGKFDSVASVSRIRRIGLRPPQEILVTIIRKTFFQKGAGRKEEALLRGLGTVSTRATANKIINIMLRNDLLTTFKGDEGAVYAPNRAYAHRMQSLLDKLNTSDDPLWVEVSAL